MGRDRIAIGRFAAGFLRCGVIREMLIGPWSVQQAALRGSLEVLYPHPAGQWVPSGENLAHHLQVIDSKRLKSAAHSVNRTAGRSRSVSRTAADSHELRQIFTRITEVILQ
jgi:hypothetical protein